MYQSPSNIRVRNSALLFITFVLHAHVTFFSIILLLFCHYSGVWFFPLFHPCCFHTWGTESLIIVSNTRSSLMSSRIGLNSPSVAIDWPIGSITKIIAILLVALIHSLVTIAVISLETASLFSTFLTGVFIILRELRHGVELSLLSYEEAGVPELCTKLATLICIRIHVWQLPLSYFSIILVWFFFL